MEKKELRIGRKSFLECLTLGSAFAGKSKTVALLDNARMVLDAGRRELTVMSTNGEFSISERCTLADVVGGDMDFCFNPTDLIRALKTLRDEELAIEVLSASMVVRHTKGVVELPILESTEYPTMDRVESTEVYRIDSGLLHRWIGSARSFVSTDALRPIMCGMYFYVRGSQMGMCATDSRLLITDNVGESVEQEAMKGVVIPLGAFGAILDMLNGTEEAFVKFDDRGIAIKAGTARLTCKVVNGMYPNFERVLPKDNQIEVRISKGEMQDSIGRALILADKAKSLVRLDVEGMTMKAVSEDMTYGKKSADETMCEHTGEDIRIGVHGELFMRCVNEIDSDTLYMRMKSPSAPILFVDENCMNKRIILMPMMVD